MSHLAPNQAWRRLLFLPLRRSEGEGRASTDPLVMPVHARSLVEVTNFGTQTAVVRGLALIGLSMAMGPWPPLVVSTPGLGAGSHSPRPSHSWTSTSFPLSWTCPFYPQAGREGARTWLLAESLLIMGPCIPSFMPHCWGCHDGHPCHPVLHHSSCDLGALTPRQPIPGNHKHLYPRAAKRISCEEPCSSLFILPQDICS